MKNVPALLLSLCITTAPAAGQTATRHVGEKSLWSVRMADSFLRNHPGAVTYDSGSPNRDWNYEQGFFLYSLLTLARVSGTQAYETFVRRNIDSYVNDKGAIDTYSLREFNLDNIAGGRVLLSLFASTGEPKYKAAADSLRRQLAQQPRTHEGGFWHKLIYPWQMWLDGLYMAEPFYAAYARAFGDSSAFDDIVDQFVWMALHAREPHTGLFYHGWDESRKQQWADSVTGCSPSFWGRAMGWYCMALVDVLDDLPAGHGGRRALRAILNDLSVALMRYRDPGTGMWFQVVNRPRAAGNYLETSASCMFAYAFAKGARRGYLPGSFQNVAKVTMNGVIKKEVSVAPNGTVTLSGTCRGAGLGGTPYRDGSYSYYINEPQRLNDLKGFGAFILAAVETERSAGCWEKSGQKGGTPR
jgi:unsaturated rhamnogalacturonyl hydrolase